MKSLVFRKRFEFANAPADWRPVRATLDWLGNPLVLMVEGKGDSPSFREDTEGWLRWYRTPPKAHHVIYWDGEAVRSVCLEDSQGITSWHIQRFREGWLLGESRGGRTVVYDPRGRITGVFDHGDASEDLQTTSDGKTWVSYFDEGVYGGGLGVEGVICFDSAGLPVFRFSDLAQAHGLPLIDDCYAMNVTSEGEVWLNYYSHFPLVKLRDFTLQEVHQPFRHMGHAFAVRGTQVLYLQGRELMVSDLAQPEEQQAVSAVDEQGVSILSAKEERVAAAGRGASFLLKTDAALFELVHWAIPSFQLPIIDCLRA